MHPRQSPGGGRLSGLRYRVGFLAHRPNQLQRKDLRPMNSRTKEAIPPQTRGRILSYPLLDFFHPLSPVCRFSPIRLALPTRPPRVAVASVPDLRCGHQIGDTNL